MIDTRDLQERLCKLKKSTHFTRIFTQSEGKNRLDRTKISQEMEIL